MLFIGQCFVFLEATVELKVNFYRRCSSATTLFECKNESFPLQLPSNITCVLLSASQCNNQQASILHHMWHRQFNTWKMCQKQIHLLCFTVSQKFKFVQFKYNLCCHSSFSIYRPCHQTPCNSIQNKWNFIIPNGDRMSKQ